MGYIIKNKFKLIFLVILLLLGVAASVFINTILFSDNFGIAYGIRIDGIEKYKVNDQSVKEIAAKFAADNNLKIRSSVHGKLVSFIIEVKDMEIDKAKELANGILPKFNAEELVFFDIQVFLNGDNKDVYPKIGYKHQSSQTLIWSN